MKTITVEVTTDYPAQFEEGTPLHSSTGFLIGYATRVVED